MSRPLSLLEGSGGIRRFCGCGCCWWAGEWGHEGNQGNVQGDMRYSIFGQLPQGLVAKMRISQSALQGGFPRGFSKSPPGAAVIPQVILQGVAMLLCQQLFWTRRPAT